VDTIIVCADDYAISPGVSRAIRRLAAAGSIDATSCMSTTAFWPDEGRALRTSKAPIEVGLHLALTGSGSRSLGRLARDAFSGRLDRAAVEIEIDRQIDAFERVWGSPPDFIDGHQHVHQFPTVRAAVLARWDRRLDRGRTWLRVSDAGIGAILRAGTAPLKSLAIAALGRAMKRSARRVGIRTNDSLAGVYDLSARRPYGELFERMCDAARGRTVIMCHPGDVDAALRDADALVDVRAVECAYFESDAYRDLRARYAGRAT
jgi:chitin disaccharide deacetylase